MTPTAHGSQEFAFCETSESDSIWTRSCISQSCTTSFLARRQTGLRPLGRPHQVCLGLWMSVVFLFIVSLSLRGDEWQRTQREVSIDAATRTSTIYTVEERRDGDGNVSTRRTTRKIRAGREIEFEQSVEEVTNREVTTTSEKVTNAGGRKIETTKVTKVNRRTRTREVREEEQVTNRGRFVSRKVKVTTTDGETGDFAEIEYEFNWLGLPVHVRWDYQMGRNGERHTGSRALVSAGTIEPDALNGMRAVFPLAAYADGPVFGTIVGNIGGVSVTLRYGQERIGTFAIGSMSGVFIPGVLVRKGQMTVELRSEGEIFESHDITVKERPLRNERIPALVEALHVDKSLNGFVRAPVTSWLPAEFIDVVPEVVFMRNQFWDSVSPLGFSDAEIVFMVPEFFEQEESNIVLLRPNNPPLTLRDVIGNKSTQDK